MENGADAAAASDIGSVMTVKSGAFSSSGNCADSLSCLRSVCVGTVISPFQNGTTSAAWIAMPK